MNRRNFIKTSGLALAGAPFITLEAEATALPCFVLWGVIIAASAALGWKAGGCAKKAINPPPPMPPTTNNVSPMYPTNSPPAKKQMRAQLAAQPTPTALDCSDATDIFYVGGMGMTDPNTGNEIQFLAQTCFQVTTSLNNPQWIDIPFRMWFNSTFAVFQFGNRKFGTTIQQTTYQPGQSPSLSLADPTGWDSAFWRAKQLV